MTHSFFDIPHILNTVACTLLTLCAFFAGKKIYLLLGKHSLAQPVIVGIAFSIIILTIFDIPYQTFADGTEALNFLLGTATVALAIPLYQNLALIRSHARSILTIISLGAILSSGLSVFIAWLMGAPAVLIRSIAPKSITTPMAISVSETIGGYPALSAAIVIVVGLIVAVLAEPVFRYLHISNPVVMGTTMGLTGHGIATARAVEMDPKTGAFSALAMGLTGIYTSTLLPIIASFF